MNAFKIVTMGLLAISSLTIADEPEAAALSLEVVEATIPSVLNEDFLDDAYELALAEEEGKLVAEASQTEILPVAKQEASPAPAPMLTPRVESLSSPVQIDMREVFAGAPLIYSLLLVISVATFALWFYVSVNMRTEKLMPEEAVAALEEKLSARKVEEALAICKSSPSLLSRMLSSGLSVPHANQLEMLEAMQNEGKRASGGFWQKLGLLNDVAIVAPMIGLLGTVVGMFYAFYDINRSVESMNSLFDGLGVSVGTTVAGLILAIFALILHSISKYRLVRQLTQVECTAHNLASRLYQTAPKEEKNA